MTRAKSAAALGLAVLLSSILLAEPRVGLPADPVRLTVGLAGHTKSYLPLYLARERTARDEGLDLELVGFSGGAQAVAALVSGSVDVALASLDTLITTTGQTRPVRAFYGGFNQADLEWFAGPGIPTWDALRGRTLAVSAPGSLTDFLTRHVLRRRGLEGGVRLMTTGSPAVRWQALRAGRVDATVLQAPQKWEALAQGFTRLGTQAGEIGPEWPTNVIFARDEFVQARADVLRAFLRAHVRALRLAKSDRAQGITVLARWLRYDETSAARAYDETIGGFDERGRLPAVVMPVFWSMVMEAGEAAAPWPEDRYLDRRFLDSFDRWAPR